MAKNNKDKSHPEKANNSILDKLTPKDLEKLAHNPELLDNLSPKVKYGLEIRSAPLPTPEDMAGYKDVDSTLPDRITKMAEQHTHKNAVAGPKMIFTAMWMAFVICVILLGLAAFFAYLGNNLVAGMFGIGPVLGLLVIIFQKLPSQ